MNICKNFYLLWLTVFLFASSSLHADTLTVTNATLISSPNAEPIENSTIKIVDSVIVSVSQETVDLESHVLDVSGHVVTAGLWNSHVHLEQAMLNNKPQNTIREMLLKYGFTSILDTGSSPFVIQEVREKIAAGELQGPRIVAAEGGLVYTNGTPIYLPELQLPEVNTAAEAPAIVQSILDLGADGIKIFAGSHQGEAPSIILPPDIIAAISAAAHKRGAFVVSHPQEYEGLYNSVTNGVDILAHTTPRAGILDDVFISLMLKNDVTLIPTLSLWSWELSRHDVPQAVIDQFEKVSIQQLADFQQLGGRILFGTDVGYMSEFNTSREFILMEKARLDFSDILATLTTNPARWFSDDQGIVAVGEPGDLVVYAGDPQKNVQEFSNVLITVRGGSVVYSKQPKD